MCFAVMNLAWGVLDADKQLKRGKYEGRTNWHWAANKLLYGVRCARD